MDFESKALWSLKVMDQFLPFLSAEPRCNTSVFNSQSSQVCEIIHLPNKFIAQFNQLKIMDLIGRPYDIMVKKEHFEIFNLAYLSSDPRMGG